MFDAEAWADGHCQGIGVPSLTEEGSQSEIQGVISRCFSVVTW